MHYPTDRITHTTAFVTPVVEHRLEREIAQWVHPMKDRSDDPPHHERTLYIWATSRSLAGTCPVCKQYAHGHKLPLYFADTSSVRNAWTNTRVRRRWNTTWPRQLTTTPAPTVTKCSCVRDIFVDIYQHTALKVSFLLMLSWDLV